MNPRGFFTIAAAVFVVGIISRQITLITVGLLAMLILGAAWAWQRWCLRGVEYTRHLSEDHIFWGETTELMISLVNRKLLPLSWIETDEEFSAKLEFVGYDLEAVNAIGKVGLGHTTSLRWFERVNWRYQVHCEQRGLYLFDTVSLRSGDIFGLYTRHEERTIPGHLFVYPRMVTLPELGMPARYPFGDVRSPNTLLDDPVRSAGVRDYRPEDPFKRIHWKATARRQELQVRVFEKTTTQTLAIFMNIETFLYYWEGIEPERAEWAITVAASLARYGDAQRYSVGLYTNAAVLESGEAIRILPGRNPHQLVRILEALARLLTLPVQGFHELLQAESGRLPWGSTIVVVTPIVPEHMVATLVRLKERGHKVVLCALTPKPPAPISGIITYHLPLPKAAPRPAPPPIDLGTAPPAGVVWTAPPPVPLGATPQEG
jgi:uncharacterized protein (DUF58 family)